MLQETLRMVERGSVEGFLCATTFTTIDYLLGQSLSELEAREAIRKLLSLFEIASVNRVVLAAAVESSMRDFGCGTCPISQP